MQIRPKTEAELLDQMALIAPSFVEFGQETEDDFSEWQAHLFSPITHDEHLCEVPEHNLKIGFGKVLFSIQEQHARGKKPLATILDEAFHDPANQKFIGGRANGEEPHYGYTGAIRTSRRVLGGIVDAIGKENSNENLRHPEWLDPYESGLVLNQNLDLARNFFPNGNFLYHGTFIEHASSIVENGELSNAMQAGKAYLRSPFAYSSGGMCGISWNFNGLNAVPGTPLHLCGFLASPERLAVLDKKFFVPVDAAPHELQSVDTGLNVDAYKQAHVQKLLWDKQGKEVFQILDSIHGKRGDWHHSNLYNSLQQLRKGKITVDDLRSWYSFNDGATEFSAELLDRQVSVLLVALQSTIDSGDANARGNRAIDTVLDLNDHELLGLIDIAAHEFWEDEYNTTMMRYMAACETGNRNPEVPLEELVFVCGRNELERVWKERFAHSRHAPKAVLVFDDKEIHVPNFMIERGAGDHSKLESVIRAVIPEQPTTQQWADFLPAEAVEMKKDAARHLVSTKQTLASKPPVFSHRS